MVFGLGKKKAKGKAATPTATTTRSGRAGVSQSVTTRTGSSSLTAKTSNGAAMRHSTGAGTGTSTSTAPISRPAASEIFQKKPKPSVASASPAMTTSTMAVADTMEVTGGTYNNVTSNSTTPPKLKPPPASAPRRTVTPPDSSSSNKRATSPLKSAMKTSSRFAPASDRRRSSGPIDVDDIISSNASLASGPPPPVPAITTKPVRDVLDRPSTKSSTKNVPRATPPPPTSSIKNAVRKSESFNTNPRHQVPTRSTNLSGEIHPLSPHSKNQTMKGADVAQKKPVRTHSGLLPQDLITPTSAPSRTSSGQGLPANNNNTTAPSPITPSPRASASASASASPTKSNLKTKLSASSAATQPVSNHHLHKNPYGNHPSRDTTMNEDLSEPSMHITSKGSSLDTSRSSQATNPMEQSDSTAFANNLAVNSSKNNSNTATGTKNNQLLNQHLGLHRNSSFASKSNHSRSNHSRSNHSRSRGRTYSGGPGGDDMSVFTVDTSAMSVTSKISVHMDAFLAEMAMADNDQLEQLAVEEMKHRQIIPQKIKKLNKRIQLIVDERDVLVGLIDQLSELVQNQETKARKKAAKKKKKQEKKKAKKAAKKQAKKKAAAAAAADSNQVVGNDNDGDDIMRSPDGTMNDTTITSTEEHVDDGDLRDILGSSRADRRRLDSSGGGDGDDDENVDFAKLWNDSADLEGGGSDRSSLGGGGVGTSFLNEMDDALLNDILDPQPEFSNENNIIIDMESAVTEDDILAEEARSGPKERSPPKKHFSGFKLIETLPDRDAIDFPSYKDSDEGSDTEDSALGNVAVGMLVAGAVAGAGAVAVSAARSSGDDTDSQASPSEHDYGSDMDINAARQQGRFSVFQETDTYLPDNMPGSRGNSPSGSQAGNASDSESYYDDSSASQSRSDDSGNNDMLDLDDSDEEEGPSAGHNLAKQLMARLTQQEAKQKEQEELQESLHATLVRRTSERRLVDSGGLESQGMVDHSYAGHGDAQTRRTDLVRTGSVSSLQEMQKSFSALGPGARRQGLARGLSVSSMNDTMAATMRNADNSMLEELASLKKELKSSEEELEQLRMERIYQEAKVRELLAALDQQFDDDDDDDDDDEVDEEDDEDLDEKDGENGLEDVDGDENRGEKDEDEGFDDVDVDAGGDDDEDDDINSETGDVDGKDADADADADGDGDIGVDVNLKTKPQRGNDIVQAESPRKKKKKMNLFLKEKVKECADLSATVETLKEQLSTKESEIEKLRSQKPQNDDDDEVPGLTPMGTQSQNGEKKEDSAAPGPPALIMSVSQSLSKTEIEKQLLEKSGECIDLRDQIEKLNEALLEKDAIYEEVHRDLFTANLALGVEVDRKASAQQALDEKKQELEGMQKANEELKGQLSAMEEKYQNIDNELVAKASLMDDVAHKHEEELWEVSGKLREKELEVTEATNQLQVVKEKLGIMESQYDDLRDKGANNENMVNELKQVLALETDKSDQFELRVGELEKEKEVLEAEVRRLMKENEINKTLIQDKDNNSAVDGQGTATIQEEVTKLIGENAELSKELKKFKEDEAALLSERERLLANATNMSIMLADSRAKVDFLQMQLEEYKNGTLTNSQHGIGSQSEHGLASPEKRGLRKLAGSLTGTNSGLTDNSERSLSGTGANNNRQRGERFRSFLQNRVNRPTGS